VKVGRFTAGFLAAVVAAPVTCLTAVVEFRIARALHWQLLVGVFVGVAGGVLWLGEEYGLIAEPYRDNNRGPFSLK
jgi:hypothetical protein